MRLFWQYLQAHWLPPDRHICATTGSSERPRPASGGIGYAVLMEAKGINGVNDYHILNSGSLFTIQRNGTISHRLKLKKDVKKSDLISDLRFFYLDIGNVLYRLEKGVNK